jgi:hypothetical protein
MSGVVYTGEQLMTGVIDNGEKHTGANIPANFHKNLGCGSIGALGKKT